jgi:hypothetical protein
MQKSESFNIGDGDGYIVISSNNSRVMTTNTYDPVSSQLTGTTYSFRLGWTTDSLRLRVEGGVPAVFFQGFTYCSYIKIDASFRYVGEIQSSFQTGTLPVSTAINTFVRGEDLAWEKIDNHTLELGELFQMAFAFCGNATSKTVDVTQIGVYYPLIDEQFRP